ncbi:MAG: glutamate ligase domain-containing protein, partial [Gammaproteobacteria bacterium]
RLPIHTHLGEARLETPLIGDFNAQNLVLVLAVLLTLNFPLAAAVNALSRLKSVSGRLEAFGGTERCPRIYVDFAHSPDSLERVLRVLRALSAARVLCVFGCGGNRDRSKRPLMGAIAERFADQVYLTADNPRDENPRVITSEILAGFTLPARVTVIEDRPAAISAALNAAAPDDIVLIAGKGHETEQEIAGRVIPMSDQALVRDWLAGHA